MNVKSNLSLNSERRRLTLGAIWLGLLLTLLLLELHVPVVHHSTSQLVDAHLFLRVEPQDVDGTLLEE